MTSPPVAVGLDFGTTNSAVAIARPGHKAEVVPLPTPAGGTVTYWRTVLCFEPAEDRAPMRSSAGAPAIARYAESEGVARLLQSIKSHLASASFVDTSIFGKRLKVEELIAVYLRALRAASPVDLGRRVVVGRPVRYWGADSEADDTRAVTRMRTALGLAGFDEVTFAFEPVAAAHAYATRLDHDELVLIADFGGGTSDFSVVEVGPRAGARVRATSGVAVAGDAFDARVVDHVIAPPLGKGSRYKVEMGGEAQVPSWIYNALRRWHHLSMLKSPETMRLLDRVVAGALDPAAISRLLHVIEDDLGLPLHASVEASKLALSRAERAPFHFARPGVAIDDAIVRAAFDAWIEADLDAIDGAVTEALAAAGVDARDIDRVFATGGSSLVPAVRGRLAARFGADRLVGGQELTSVAAGLAEMAAIG
jgi:hypothetical chaperone protein